MVCTIMSVVNKFEAFMLKHTFVFIIVYFVRVFVLRVSLRASNLCFFLVKPAVEI